MKRAPAKVKRPRCAGWHIIDKVCNGDSEDRVPCAYREQCLAIVGIVGGVERRTEELVEEALKSTEYEIWRWSEHRGQDPPLFEPDASNRGRSHRKNLEDEESAPAPCYPRPDGEFGAALGIVDMVVERFARDIGRVLVAQDDENRSVGDLFLRYEAARDGRVCRLYEATKTRRRYHRLLVKFQMTKGRRSRKDRPRGPAHINVLANCEDYAEAYNHRPPAGLECRAWRDSHEWVTVIGVKPGLATETGRWLARLYGAGLLLGKQ